METDKETNVSKTSERYTDEEVISFLYQPKELGQRVPISQEYWKDYWKTEGPFSKSNITTIDDPYLLDYVNNYSESLRAKMSYEDFRKKIYYFVSYELRHDDDRTLEAYFKKYPTWKNVYFAFLVYSDRK